jgi:putative peptidoglycan lipid II flippase
MVCTMTTRLLGFVRGLIIAALFGTTWQADILNAVFAIPNNFRKLMAEGALSSAFIPVFSETTVKDPTHKLSQELANNIFSFQLIILLPILILSAIFSKEIIYFLLEFKEDEYVILAADLFRYLIFYLLFVSISAILMGILNSHNMFVIPALTPLFFSIAVISSLLLLYRSLGIFAMAVGVLSGGLLQVVFQIPFFKRLGYGYRFKLDWSNPRFRRVLKLWFPVVATSSIFAVNHIIAVRFATGLSEGSVTALSYAIIFWQLPFGIFSASITTVLFPRMSRQAAENNLKGLSESVSYGLRFLFVVLIPATVFFILSGSLLIRVAYQRGAFTLADAILTANVLVGYSLGLFCVGGFNFLQRFFYAAKDYITPIWIAGVVTVVDVAFSLWLKETPLGVIGLALANSIAFSLGIVLMLAFTKKRLDKIGGYKIIATVIRVAISLVPATAILYFFNWQTKRYLTEYNSLINLLVLLGGFFLFVLLVLVFYYISKIEILRDIISGRFRQK